MNNILSRKFLAICVFIGMLLFTLIGARNYPGQNSFLFGFTVCVFLFGLGGAVYSSSYFSFFLSCFLTVGIWVKLIYHLCTNNLVFTETIGNFDFSGTSHDKVLIFSMAGMFGFLLSIISGEFLWRKYLSKLSFSFKRPAKLTGFYLKYKPLVLLGISFLILGVTIFNYYFQIYQRGTISTASNGQLKGVVTWALMFGLSAIVTIFLNIDFCEKKNLVPATLISFMEAFASSVSMLSRGFVLNAGSILVTLFKIHVEKKAISKSEFSFSILSFLFFFFCSLTAVTHFRFYTFEPISVTQTHKPNASHSLLGLVIDRWVGLEGIMTTTSFDGNREIMFNRIWNESIAPGTSLYDMEIGKSFYSKNLNLNHQFVTIPGFIGWISLLNNWYLVFALAFIFGFICIMIECWAKLLTNNIFFCSLIGQVLAYRISHFGFLPKQSYKLFGAVLFTIALLYLINFLTSKIGNRYQ